MSRDRLTPNKYDEVAIRQKELFYVDDPPSKTQITRNDISIDKKKKSQKNLNIEGSILTHAKKKQRISDWIFDINFQNITHNNKPVARNKKHKLHFRVKPGKRMFERRSGTGRGREISKDGAGGKTIWGNLNQLAKEESIEFMYQEQVQQLHEKRNKFFKFAETFNEVDEHLHKKENEIIISVASNYTKDKISYNIPEEYRGLSHSHNLKSKQEEKRRKKVGSFNTEERSEIFELLKDSITYDEYLLSLKEKNKNLPNKQNTAPDIENLSKYSTIDQFPDIHPSKNLEKKKIKKKPSNIEDQLNIILSQQLSLTNEEREENTF
jgi:hypothetical protein